MIKRVIISTSVALAMSTAVHAQDYYIGAAYGAGSSKFTGFTGRSRTEDANDAAFFAGMRFDQKNDFFLGAEIEVGKFTNKVLSSYSGKSQRFRAIAGYKFNRFEIFATAGIARFQRVDGFPPSRDHSGITYGIGANYHINDRWAVRTELLVDDLQSLVGTTYEWENQTARVGVLFKF